VRTSHSPAAKQRAYVDTAGNTPLPPGNVRTGGARAISSPVFSPLYACAQSSWAVKCEMARFSGGFFEGGGLKNRRLAECKISIGQVLISRTLTVCGEVAERLKAAVC
jgi:hypothetical protein